MMDDVPDDDRVTDCAISLPGWRLERLQGLGA